MTVVVHPPLTSLLCGDQRIFAWHRMGFQAWQEIWLVASAVASALAVSSQVFSKEPSLSAEVDNIFADAAFNMDPHAAMELRGSA